MCFAKEHGVIMLCLPPHTTHESQPLDCGVFGPLKTQWSHVCHIYFQKHPGKVITWFQFSTLFSEAWGKAVSLCNIIAGFCTCGVFPFSPEAIKIPAAEEDTDKGKGGTGSSSGQASPQLNTAQNEPPPVNPSNLVSTNSHLTSCNFSDSANVTTASLSRAEGTSHVTVTEGDKRFTHEQLERFQRAYDEGCDVYINPTYVQWLELYHPESLPADRYSLIPAAEESHQMSVAEHFHSVTPEVPLAFANRANAPQSTLDGAVINTASADGTNATQTEATSHDQSNSLMSKYLVLPLSSTPAPKALPRARLLTSAECLSQLEEKERQK